MKTHPTTIYITHSLRLVKLLNRVSVMATATKTLYSLREDWRGLERTVETFFFHFVLVRLFVLFCFCFFIYWLNVELTLGKNLQGLVKKLG